MKIGEWSKGKNREKSPTWKGGRYINDAGYNMVYNPEHHRASSNGYVREHILMAEKALGKPLPEGVQVHHYGENGNNGKIVICENQEYHALLHIRAKAYEACGNANYRKCKFCQKYDDPGNLYIKKIKASCCGWNVYHMECARAYDRERYRKRKCL